jgi:hypothetical protein
MTQPRVLVVVITKDFVEAECMESIVGQDYRNYRWMIHGMHPKYTSNNSAVEMYANCSMNREIARKLALASDAEFFLFMDSDIAIPEYAISEFVLQAENSRATPDSRIKLPPGMVSFPVQPKHIIGGWYKMQQGNRWVAGTWVEDNRFVNCLSPAPSLTKVDVVGLGCAFISRQALSELPFEDGLGLECQDAVGRTIIVGECGIFGNRAFEKGYEMWMDGSVVCKHLSRKSAEETGTIKTATTLQIDTRNLRF